jgi:hypothetical protein
MKKNKFQEVVGLVRKMFPHVHAIEGSGPGLRSLTLCNGKLGYELEFKEGYNFQISPFPSNPDRFEHHFASVEEVVVFLSDLLQPVEQ